MRLLDKEGIVHKIITKTLLPLYIDVPALRPGTVGAYTLALVSAGIATALRVALDPFLEGAQFVTFYPAIVITTLISGFGAGFFCTILSTAAADFFVLSPRWSFYVDDPAIVADLLLFGPLASYLVIIIAQMRTAIEREQAEASRERLQLALDAARLGWWQYDPLRRVFSWDTRSKEIFGVPADGATVEEFMTWVHPDDVERVWAACNAALDPAEPQRAATQFRLRRREGKVGWVETFGLAYFGGDGRDRRAVSIVGIAADVTERKEREDERKQREEKEHLLMREINHRAKNMLSVVDAIAHQTAARSPEDFVDRFSERIQALSANQDLLIRNEWRGVDVEDLVRAQLAHFADLICTRIAMQGPKLRLNPASAQAIGLALHELATNAGKYGALSDTGRVNVCWGTDGKAFTMTWTEHDGPPVSPPHRRGFGTVVMKEMVERSVDGRVELDCPPSGVTWRVSCPAVNALEPTASRQSETRERLA
jgi:PAS domain S-box-containing protein